MRSAVIFLSAALAACHAEPVASNSIGKERAEAPFKSVKPITEVFGLQFGEDFETVLAQFPYDYFNPASVLECPDEMPFEGCTLFPRRNEPAYFRMIDGVPYDISLGFDTKAKLDEFSIKYDRDDDITHDQCVEVFERTVDWLADDHGEPVDNPNRDPDDLAPAFKSPGGHHFRKWVSEDGNVIADTVFRASEPVQIFVLGHSIEVDGEVNCGIGARFVAIGSDDR